MAIDPSHGAYMAGESGSGTDAKGSVQGIRIIDLPNLFDRAADPILIHAQWRVVYANPPLLRLLRVRDPAHFIGGPWNPPVPEPEIAGYRDHVERVYAGEARAPFERLFLREDSSEVQVEVSASPFILEGRPAGLVIVRDISRRREDEAILRDSEQRYRDLFKSNPLPMIVFDVETLYFLAANRAACEKYGYSRDEFLGMTLLDVFVPEDAERLQVAQRKRASEVLRHLSGFRHRLRDGTVIDVEMSSHVMTTEGRLARTVVVFDVTERLRAERALRESEARYRAVFEQAGVGIARVDLDGRFLEANEKLAQIVGYSREELLSLRFQDITLEGDLAADVDSVRGLVAGRAASFQMEKRYRSKTGAIVWVNLTVALVRDAEGSPRYFVSVIEDIDQRKRAEELLASSRVELEAAVERLRASEGELRQHRDRLSELVRDRTSQLSHALDAAEAANRAKSEFVANMSHEFRTPLHAIGSFASLGTKRVDVGGPVQKLGDYFLRIEESSRRLLGLVNGLLDIAKLEAGKVELRVRNGDMGRLLHEVAAGMASVAHARDIRLEVSIGTQDARASFDTDRIFQVVQNLLSNALKFSPPGSAVLVALGEDRLDDGAPALRIDVSDAGPGIPAGELDSIFRKFEQSSATRSSAGGTGLGLAISREICLLHGGDISARNGQEGGAVFSVRLPRGNHTEQPA